MRCKNCGAENNDGRYICETCGSPLYDEDESPVAADNERTQVFSNKDINNEVNRQSVQPSEPKRTPSPAPQKEPQDKKSMLVIAILVVILVAIIASTIAVAANKRNSTKTTEPELTRYSSTTTEKTTEETTTEKTTTEETTTEKTTKEQTWIINTSSSGGGETEGEGTYKNGEKVVLIARPDDEYAFDGWYSDGVMVSADTKYEFTANENASFTAVFSPVEYEPETEESEADTTEETDESSENDVQFGD